MTTENESSTGSEESAAPASDGRAVMSEKRYEPQPEEALERGLDNQPKPPRYAPAPGLRHAYDAKTGVWRVERDPNFKEDGTPEPESKADVKDEGEEEQQETPPGVELPDILPDHIRDSPEIQTLVAEGVAAMKLGGEYGDPEVQRVLDLVSQFELEVGAEQPNLHEEDRIRSILRARWGELHDGRLKAVNAYVNARPALRSYLNRTGAGNQLSVLEALGLIADGTMGVTPSRAAEIMQEQRNNPKSPLRDPYHKGHGLAVQQAKVLADIMDRGEKSAAKKAGRQADVKEMAADRTAKEPAGDSPEAKIDAEIRQLRMDPAYSDKSKPNHKVVIERVRELYRQRYPD